MSRINNIHELRADLLEAYEELRKDPRRVNQAKESANLAGKILGTLSAEMEYAAMRKEQPEIPFMGKTKALAEKTK